ncbi:HAAS signaling domain-containing protein [Haloplasma contractile]|uniref:tRNA 2-methylthioadenosine synthase protein n=1 Tax=Haloplasma contractile SSD-17B TaxID=1033810 RepID=U2FG02_9MOLU|nr:DUF1700 domain-containing protein [Haloplasma contractile]ERJ11830.1 tRNA 2-methylthioadenosine synthase protein [Haloplasma contractile SSD-17B]
MDKQTFLKTLENKLIILNENEREDILTEYSDVIDQKVKEGKSQVEAVKDFGNIKELVREIYDAYRISKDCDELVTSREHEIVKVKQHKEEQTYLLRETKEQLEKNVGKNKDRYDGIDETYTPDLSDNELSQDVLTDVKDSEVAHDYDSNTIQTDIEIKKGKQTKEKALLNGDSEADYNNENQYDNQPEVEGGQKHGHNREVNNVNQLEVKNKLIQDQHDYSTKGTVNDKLEADPFLARMKKGTMNVLAVIRKSIIVAYNAIKSLAMAAYFKGKKGVQHGKRKMNQILDEHNALKRLELNAVKAERDYTRTKENLILNVSEKQANKQPMNKSKVKSNDSAKTISKFKDARLLRKQISAEYKCLTKEKQIPKRFDADEHEPNADARYDYTMAINQHANSMKGNNTLSRRKSRALLNSQKIELKAIRKAEKKLQKSELRSVKQTRKFERKLSKQTNYGQHHLMFTLFLIPIMLFCKFLFTMIYIGFYLFLSFCYVASKTIYFSLYLIVALLSAIGSLLLLGFMTGFLVAAFKFHYVYLYPGLVCLGIFVITIGSTASIDSIFKFINRCVSTLFAKIYYMSHRLFKRVILEVRD